MSDATTIASAPAAMYSRLVAEFRPWMYCPKDDALEASQTGTSRLSFHDQGKQVTGSQDPSDGTVYCTWVATDGTKVTGSVNCCPGEKESNVPYGKLHMPVTVAWKGKPGQEEILWCGPSAAGDTVPSCGRREVENEPSDGDYPEPKEPTE